MSRPLHDAWDRITSRLDAMPGQPVVNVRRINRNVLIASLVAIAVAVLVVISIRTQLDETLPHGHSHSVRTTIDLSELVVGSARQQMDAVNTFASRYESKEVTLEAAKGLLGYQPSISSSLPPGVQLVSTRVLKLPKCNCEEGKCTCGPTGCNCASSVCKRDDGSLFVVLEHCKSQDISFGDAPIRRAAFGSQEVQLIESPDKGIVASWLSHDRRLTVLGLRDAEEANLLVVSMN